jgi:NodT family efflux transporter outer membrane factor (OMF) lipoprotein
VEEALGSVAIPPRWQAPAGTSDPVPQNWLATLEAPRLHELVRESLARNADLRVAAARVEQAQAQLKVAASALSPAVNVLGRTTEKLSGGGGLDVKGIFLTAAWEIDVWGRVRYGVRGGAEQVAATRADYAFAQQSIAALVAKSWALAAEAELQRQLTQEVLKSSGKLLDVSRERLRIGAGTELDIALAESSLQSYRDTLRQLELAVEQSLRAIELLAGRYPAAELMPAPELVKVDAPVAAGIPMSLLDRRPDILAAERRVASAFNYLEQAKVAHLPNISLAAGLLWIKQTLFVLSTRDNPSGSVNLTGAMPLFDGGALEGQVEARTAEQQRAIADYAGIALKAFNEVESALAAEAALRDRVPLLERIVFESGRSLELSGVQYRVGVIDLRTVLNDELRLYSARSQLLRLQSEQMVQRINLYLALGGGV